MTCPGLQRYSVVGQELCPTNSCTPCSAPPAQTARWLHNQYLTGTQLVQTLGLGLSSVQGMQSVQDRPPPMQDDKSSE